jgi:hypothetical protein
MQALAYEKGHFLWSCNPACFWYHNLCFGRQLCGFPNGNNIFQNQYYGLGAVPLQLVE